MTDLEIINRSLKRLGCLPAATLADTTKNQARAIESYPRARDEILRLFAWPTVTGRAELLDLAELRCQWILSHVYHEDDYCTNDTGKVYRVITAGTSAVAGGPTGTASDITDGTVHWEYVEANDLETNWAWRPSTAYAVGAVVGNQDGMVFYCITLGTSAATGGPAAEDDDITDGTAHWCHYATTPDNLTAHLYQYLYPVDSLRLLKLPENPAKPETSKGAMYLLEGNYIYTDIGEAIVKYIEKQEGALDPTHWDSLLQATVVLRLAEMIAFDVTGKTEVLAAVDAEFVRTTEFARGVATDEGSEGHPEPDLWEDA